MSDESYVGVIVDWNGPSGWGFIGRDDGQDDAFVHIRDCLTELDALPIGARVRFKLREDLRSGRIQGFDCAVISDTRDSEFATGSIKHWDEDGRRYAFIQPDDGSEDVFAHRSAFIGDLQEFPTDTRVRFSTGSNPRTGRPRALNVQPAIAADREAKNILIITEKIP